MYFLLKTLVLWSNIDMKKELRKRAKEIRKTLDIKALSLEIKEKVFSLPEFQKAKNVCCYYSFSDEVITTDYFEDKSKNWFVPKVEGDNLLICPFDKNNLVENKYGILEPSTEPINNLSILDLIIIPALCVDKNGYRIGYGKGYYDRFLSQLKHNPVKLCLVFADLIVENSYPNKFDIKNNIITCNKSIFRIY